MKKVIFALSFVFFAIYPISTFATISSEVHITRDGAATVSGVKVMQLVGSSFYTRLYWGDAFVRMTVKTNSKTKFYRGTGESTTISEIKVDDLLDITGELESGSDSLTLIASTIRNASVQKLQSSFSGKVSSVDQSAHNFTLTGTKLGTITVSTNTSTVFSKGHRTLDLAHVLVGDTISSTSGDYDINTKTLIASSVVTYVDLNKYKPQNFQGTLESVSGTSLPTTIRLSINKTSYLINLSSNTEVLNRARKPISLARYVPGDTVRVYGTLREIDDLVIDDVEIVRNTSI